MTSEKEDAAHKMGEERKFLTSLFESALQNKFSELERLVNDYVKRPKLSGKTSSSTGYGLGDSRDTSGTFDGLDPGQVLLQFKDGQKRTALHFACQSASAPDSMSKLSTSVALTTTRPEEHNNENHEDCRDPGCNKSSSPDASSDTDQILAEDIVTRIVYWSRESQWISDECIQKMIRMKDKDGLTPIMLASQCKDRVLSDSRISILLQVSSGSCIKSNNATISITTSTSALPKLTVARSKCGATALHYAAAAGASPRTIEQLYQDAPIALQTNSLHAGGTPLHWACAVPPHANNSPANSAHTDTIQTLVRLCCLPHNRNATCDYSDHHNDLLNRHDDDKRIPPALVVAIAANHSKHAIAFVQTAVQDCHADLTPTLSYKLQPGNISIFHMIADQNMVSLLALLLELYAPDDSHSTSSSKSVGASLLPMLLSSKNNDGYTPLDLAAKEGHIGCVMLLLQHQNQSSTTSSEDVTEAEALEYIRQFRCYGQTLTEQAKAEMEKAKIDSTVSNDYPIDSLSSSNRIEIEAQRYASSLLLAASHYAEDIGSKGAGSTSSDDALAERHKADGNAHFANQDFDTALRCYTAAIDAAADARVHPSIVATYYSNRSTCYISMIKKMKASGQAKPQNHQEQISDVSTSTTSETANTKNTITNNDNTMNDNQMLVSLCEKALYDAMVCRTLRPQWTKGCYRLAVARFEMGRYEDAAVSAWEGVQLDNSNSELKSLLQQAVQRGRDEHHHQQLQKQPNKNTSK